MRAGVQDSGCLAMTHETAPFEVGGRRVVVLGAGRSGVAAARLLAARGARVVVSEIRPAFDEAPVLEGAGIGVETGGHRPETLLGADLIVLSPGVSPWQPVLDEARRAGIPITGELELAWRWVRGRVIAITGTKGKSTTTTLVGRMLAEGGVRALVGGNIGVPLSAQVADSAPDTVHVIEASSFQLETTEAFRPDIAVFLNFSPDHLDRHRSVEEYAAAKVRIFANQTAADLAIVNAEDAQVMAWAAQGRARRRSFAVGSVPEAGVGIAGEWIVGRDPGRPETRLVPLAAVRVPGRHLLADVLAAAAVAEALGVTPEAIARAVEGFRGLEHALEVVAEVGGVRFVNDSKATNVEAARRALEAFPTGVVAIMGGRYKGGDLAELREPLARRGAGVVLIGEARPLFRAALAGAVPIEEAETMADAVRRARALAPPGGVVLLAPACASFDMFRDYADRGRAFKAEVARLAREAGADEP
jgi:UDP-N-acetylmuramoylalanine--D-glutamate ligase